MKTTIKYRDEKLNKFQIESISKKIDDLTDLFYIFKETNNEDDFDNLEKELKKINNMLLIYNSNNYNNILITKKDIIETENKKINELENLNNILLKRLKNKEKIIDDIENILKKDDVPF